MEETIGQIAGDVYKYLERNGEASISEVAERIDGSRSNVNMAIGWLAKEDKIMFSQKGRGTAISLDL